MGLHQPLLNLTPEAGGRLEIFFAKVCRKDKLIDTMGNFIPLLRGFAHWGENCLGGCCNPPFVTGFKSHY